MNTKDTRFYFKQSNAFRCVLGIMLTDSHGPARTCAGVVFVYNLTLAEKLSAIVMFKQVWKTRRAGLTKKGFDLPVALRASLDPRKPTMKAPVSHAGDGNALLFSGSVMRMETQLL